MENSESTWNNLFVSNEVRIWSERSGVLLCPEGIASPVGGSVGDDEVMDIIGLLPNLWDPLFHLFVVSERGIADGGVDMPFLVGP